MKEGELERKLVDDILKRDQSTGASLPLYQHIPQLEKYFAERGVVGLRHDQVRFRDYGLFRLRMKGWTVLDLGCDNGMMMYECFKRGAKLTVGIQHPKVGDEVERVAKYIGNTKAKFYGIDLKSATTEQLRSLTGIEQFDLVIFAAVDSHFSHFHDYLFDLTKKILIYEKLQDAISVDQVITWLKEKGFRKVECIGKTTDIGSVAPYPHDDREIIVARR